MSPELGLIIITCIELIALVALHQLSKDRLCTLVTLNLILVTIFGQVLFPFFGLTTNLGNIFYAVIPIALYETIDRHGYDWARKTIFTSSFLLIFFVLITKLSSTIIIAGAGTSELTKSLNLVFSASAHITLASIIAYIISQNIGIRVYKILATQYTKTSWLLRVNISNFIGQIIDSLLFFTIAFIGTMSLSGIFGIMAMGLIIKVGVGLIISSLLLVSRGFSPNSTPLSSENV